MRAIYALALAACTSTPSPAVLASDAYFFQPVGYACEPSTSAQCRFELAFCTDGTYQFWAGDIRTGTYELQDGVAVDPSADFAFDFTSGQIETDGGGTSVPYYATDAVYAVSCP